MSSATIFSPPSGMIISARRLLGSTNCSCIGYEFTQQEWNETYKKKSKLEQKLGLAGDIEENEPELEPAE